MKENPFKQNYRLPKTLSELFKEEDDDDESGKKKPVRKKQVLFVRKK